MEKPFDLKDLEARLKSRGLTAVEGLAEIIAEETFQWAADSAAIHPNSVVKGIVPGAVAIIKPMVLGQIDKIDGIPG
jgi:hypothetical protein